MDCLSSSSPATSSATSSAFSSSHMECKVNKKLRIAFGYQAQVGKDTAVAHLIEKYGGIKLSFAQPIYDILAFAQKTCGFQQSKDRKFLQWVGTEWGRSIDDNVWVNAVLRQIEENSDKNIYISDLRYPNEFETLRKAGFMLVKIVRPELDRVKTFGTGSVKHSSEIGLASDDVQWDSVITNDTDLSSFLTKIDALAMFQNNTIISTCTSDIIDWRGTKISVCHHIPDSAYN